MHRRLLLAFAWLTGLGCLATTAHADNRFDRVRPDAPELAAYGPAAVGVRTLQLVNPGQLDVTRARSGATTPRYDRPLTVEVWYPAQPSGQAGGEYRVMTRDPKTTVPIRGRAVRDAVALRDGAPYPLVIVSHGYPGNRYLLGPLAENLASKGFVVASIDHTDSTYADQTVFASTLLNRPLDQLFVLDAMGRLNAGSATDAAGGAFKDLIRVERSALVGYSMGGYGALNTIGAGFSAVAVRLPMAPADGSLASRQAVTPDARIRAAIVIGPWGWNAGFWDTAGLAGIRVPVLFMAGSADTVSGYSPGVRDLFEGSVQAPRWLLTFDNAGHNAAAPMPAPVETWSRVPQLPVVPALHYLDPVWDTVRMNNIAQHFATAFLAQHLRDDPGMPAYLDLAERGPWKGFAPGTTLGLRWESRKPR